MKIIALTFGKQALVDDADFEYLNQFKWQWKKPSTGRGSGYAARSESRRNADGKRKHVMMHNVILPPPDGLEVDHRNGDGLDNQRHNLRHATRREQAFNKACRSDNVAGIKGVTVRNGRYSAVIFVGGRNVKLGVYNTPEEASAAYRNEARKHFGEFARIDS